jgi:hypothetical protein
MKSRKAKLESRNLKRKLGFTPVGELRFVRPTRRLRIVARLALLIGLLLVVQGILGIAAPDVFVRTLRFIQTPPVIYVAAVIRVVFGVVLVCAAPGSRLPMFLRVFGSIIIIGGLLTPFVGVRFAHLILAWWTSGGPPLVRVFAGVSLVLGIFTAYAAARRHEK